MYSHPSFIKLFMGGDSLSDSGNKIINCQSSDLVEDPYFMDVNVDPIGSKIERRLVVFALSVGAWLQTSVLREGLKSSA